MPAIQGPLSATPPLPYRGQGAGCSDPHPSQTSPVRKVMRRLWPITLPDRKGLPGPPAAGRHTRRPRIGPSPAQMPRTPSGLLPSKPQPRRGGSKVIRRSQSAPCRLYRPACCLVAATTWPRRYPPTLMRKPGDECPGLPAFNGYRLPRPTPSRERVTTRVVGRVIPPQRARVGLPGPLPTSGRPAEFATGSGAGLRLGERAMVRLQRVGFRG